MTLSGSRNNFGLFNFSFRFSRRTLPLLQKSITRFTRAQTLLARLLIAHSPKPSRLLQNHAQPPRTQCCRAGWNSYLVRMESNEHIRTGLVSSILSVLVACIKPPHHFLTLRTMMSQYYLFITPPNLPHSLTSTQRNVQVARSHISHG